MSSNANNDSDADNQDPIDRNINTNVAAAAAAAASMSPPVGQPIPRTTAKSVDELQSILQVFHLERQNSEFDVLPTLTRLTIKKVAFKDGIDYDYEQRLVAELIECALEWHLKRDPDPLDERRPWKVNAYSEYSQLLRVISRDEEFVEKLLVSYVVPPTMNTSNLSAEQQETQLQLCSLSCRVLLDCMPVVDLAAIADTANNLIEMLFAWALSSETEVTLQAYAVGILAAAMEDNEIESGCHDDNAQLVPILIDRLKSINKKLIDDRQNQCASSAASESVTNQDPDQPSTSFSNVPSESFSASGSSQRPLLVDVLNKQNTDTNNDKRKHNESEQTKPETYVNARRSAIRINTDEANTTVDGEEGSAAQTALLTPPPVKKFCTGVSSLASPRTNDTGNYSNSSWSALLPIIIGEHSQMYPISTQMQQRLILQYLNQVATCQDLMPIVIEKDVIPLLLSYANMQINTDVRLAFDALKYLGSLFVHRKIALDFLAVNGVQRLIRVVNPQSLASAGVAYCLSYLAYIDDVLEKMCTFPQEDLQEVVDYALWLLEHSYETGRGYACTFFEKAFRFMPFLELFDAKDGLRKLYNNISTLAIMHPDSDVQLGEEQESQSRTAISSVVAALRVYMMSQLYVRVEFVKRNARYAHLGGMGQHAHLSAPGMVKAPAIPPGNTPRTKALHMDSAGVCDCVDWLMAVLPPHLGWKPAEQLRKLQVVPQLLFLCNELAECSWTAKGETIRQVLELIYIAFSVSRLQLELLKPISVEPNVQSDGINIVLTLCEGAVLPDADVQRAALLVVINCVCAPDTCQTTAQQPSINLSTHKRRKSFHTCSILVSTTNDSDELREGQWLGQNVLRQMWTAIRRSNGIMVLRWLIFARTPITEADSLRALACRAMDGLCRHEEIAQMIAKMNLMREPISADKRLEHQRFCAKVRSLIEKVTGRVYMGGCTDDLSIDKLYRASVVSQTKIVYNETELLQLMWLHLRKKGLNKTAATLIKEAELPNVPASCAMATPKRLEPMVRPRRALTASANQRRAVTNGPMSNGQSALNAQAQSSTSLSLKPGNAMVGGISAFISRRPTAGVRSKADSNVAQTHVSTPVRHKQVLNLRVNNVPGILPMQPHTAQPSTNWELLSPKKSLIRKPHIELDEMVLDHFRKQHAQCRNPVSACPPFSLFYPHKCPNPLLSRSAPRNFTLRNTRKMLTVPPHGGCGARRFDHQLLYSRFRPLRLIRNPDQGETFGCCRFTLNDRQLLCGTYAGDMKVYNMLTGDEEYTHTLHPSSVTSLQQSQQDGRLLLSSSAYVRPLSSLWTQDNNFGTLTKMYDFADQYFVDFAQSAVPEKAVGTNGHKATIFDMSTGRSIIELYDNDRANYYTKNRAVFHPHDDLLLSDGLLWDVRSNQIVHKFDKLNTNVSGVFHPSGLQAVINTEVWDIRTYRLLHTVQALDQCKIAFNTTGDVLLAVYQPPDEDDTDSDSGANQLWQRNFRTLDAIDYSLITTVDARNQLLDIATDSAHDQYVAVVENRSRTDTDHANLEDNYVRVYEVGRTKDDDEEDDADDNEQAGDDEEDFDDDDSDDDDDDDEIEDDDDDEDEMLDVVDDALEMIEGDDDFEDEESEDDDDQDDNDDSASTSASGSDNSSEAGQVDDNRQPGQNAAHEAGADANQPSAQDNESSNDVTYNPSDFEDALSVESMQTSSSDHADDLIDELPTRAARTRRTVRRQRR